MNIAYIILTHRYPEQLARLVRTLNSEGTSFFIHVDQRSQDCYLQASQLLAGLPNVHFVKRYACHWGHPNLVRAALSGLESIVDSRTPFDYAVLLSGQDYPIKSPDAIANFFEQHNGHQFMSYFAVEGFNPWTDMPFPWNSRTRIEYWHLVVRSRMFHIPIRRQLPYGYVPYIGYQWWAFSKEAVEYILGFVRSHPAFVKFFNHVYIPDELFFQSLLLNSPLRYTVVNNDLRFVDWDNPNPNVPATLNVDYFEQLRQSECLFARKFDANQDSQILDLIDQQLLRQPILTEA